MVCRPFRALALTALLLGLPDPIFAGTGWHAGLATGGGWDDDILGRPGEDNSFPVLSGGFLQVAPSLSGRLYDRRWSLGAGWDYVFNAYDDADAGLYHDNRLRADGGCRIDRRLRFHLRGEAEWFHRTEFQDYDFNRASIEPSLLWLVSDEWSLEGSWSFARVAYPERTVPVVGDEQVDEPSDLGVSLAFDPDLTWHLEAGGSWISTGSNSRQYEYDGWSGYTRASAILGRSWSLDARLDLQHRVYDRFLSTTRPFRGRIDDSFEIGLSADRRIAGPTHLFAAISYLDYGSDRADYAFDQTLIQGGFRFTFGSPSSHAPLLIPGITIQSTAVGRSAADPGGSDSGDDPKSLAPRIGSDGVLFRCRGEGARTVHLVGTFNEWRTDATPMADPDGDGVWEVRITLQPGLYRYAFLVDGADWRPPADAPLEEDDDFGHTNGVLDVPAPVTGGGGGGPNDVTVPRSAHD